ncbi:hypothetical protein KR009_011790 [Drosophila setifemur]|nr:hypothetical protein KR009_011790 [Drosophila setifemur]
MICLSRLVVLNLASVWPSTRSKKHDSKKKASKTDLKTTQRPLLPYTKRGYIRWFGKMSHCSRTRNIRSRLSV